MPIINFLQLFQSYTPISYSSEDYSVCHTGGGREFLNSPFLDHASDS